jgi:hypothetical protein
VSVAKRNLKEAGGKVPNRGTRTTSGISIWMSLPNKTKSNDYPEVGGVNVAVTWDERGQAYHGIPDGRNETLYGLRITIAIRGQQRPKYPIT